MNKDYSGPVRSEKEQRRIDELHEEGIPVFLTDKGHLCFQQRYPDFPMYLSAVTNLIGIAVLIVVLLLK